MVAAGISLRSPPSFPTRVCHGPIHTDSAEGYNDRVRRTFFGVFHHISPPHANLYFNGISFRWSQRVVATQARRRTIS
ncbi:transposase [Phyllobacterium myrsinacearum]|uniref:transposase n=1 Tax=Phyllobacterium myrsinacearum TaxID=28101 RepID=UPI0015FA7BD3